MGVPKNHKFSHPSLSNWKLKLQHLQEYETTLFCVQSLILFQANSKGSHIALSKSDFPPLPAWRSCTSATMNTRLVTEAFSPGGVIPRGTVWHPYAALNECWSTAGWGPNLGLLMGRSKSCLLHCYHQYTHTVGSNGEKLEGKTTLIRTGPQRCHVEGKQFNPNALVE